MLHLMNKIILKPGKDRSVFRYHPWIFSGAIAKTEGKLQEGDLVRVYSSDNQYLATGHYQIGSIAVRILTFEDEEIGYSFWLQRITAAYHMRRAIGLTDRADNDTFRLIHGEGDNLPGLVVDYYAGVAVVQFHSVGMYLERENITRALLETLGNRLTAIYDKSESTLPYKAAIDPHNGYLYGKADHFIAQENGLKFNVDWLEGQKTGFFIDQRENRHLLEKYADEPVFLLLDGAPVPFFIADEGLTVRNHTSYIVKFDYVDTLAQAGRLVGCEVLFEKRMLEGQEPEESGYDIFELIGFEVKDQVSEETGEVADVADYSGNVVLTVSIMNKEILLPFSENYICKIDFEHSRLLVQIPRELVELN